MSADSVNVTDGKHEVVSGLQRFLAGLTFASIIFSALMLVVGVAFSGLATGLAGLVSGAFALWLAIPWWLLRRRQVRVAAMAVCAGLILVAPPGAAALPHMVGTVAIVPLIAVAIGLQYLNRREMAVVIICAGLSTLAAAALAELSRASTSTPAWFQELLRIASLTTAVVLASYLIWQVSLRFRDALDRTAAVNRDLETAQADVGHANQELSLRVGDLEDRNREMELLSEMSPLLQGCRTADEVNGVIQVSLRSLFPDDRGRVLLLTPSRQGLDVVAQWGGGTPPSRLSPDACWALRRKAIHSFEAGGGDLRCAHVSAEARWALCVPLAGDGEVFGVLTLEAGRGPDRSGAPRWNRRLLAATVAEHLGLFISSFRLREKLTIESTRDPLTGLFNRRFMEESLEREARRAAREGRPLSVLMLDLDQFKAFNDAHGHQAGDELLRALATSCGRIRGPTMSPAATAATNSRSSRPTPRSRTRSAGRRRSGTALETPRRLGRIARTGRTDEESRSPSRLASPRIRSTGARPRSCFGPPIRRSSRPNATAGTRSRRRPSRPDPVRGPRAGRSDLPAGRPPDQPKIRASSNAGVSSSWS